MRPTRGDTVPVPGARVVLHRVSAAAQGPVDSVTSDARGRFRFVYPAARDTSALHLLSARYGGIEYFTVPVERQNRGAITVVVHDTSSIAPVSVSARHVVVPRAGQDGSRDVLDLVMLANNGILTRVAPDSLGASWIGPLPRESEGLEIGESDVSPDAVIRRADSAVVTAPISPGEKQLAFQYHFPAGRQRIEIPVGPEPVNLNLMLEERGASATAPGLAVADSEMIEGRAFRRWSGEVPANSIVRVTLPGPGPNPKAILAAMVTVMALALLAAAWRLLPRAETVSSDRLIGQIAVLDNRYQGREGETDAEEWARYAELRGKLKTALEAALARESGGR